MSGYKSVTNGTELALALYEDSREILLTGSLASGIYHGCKSIRRLRVCIVLTALIAFGCMYYPEMLLPGLIIMPVLMALYLLPLIYLSLAHISPRMVNRVRRRYNIVSFDAGQQSLHLKSRYKRFEREQVDIPRRRPKPSPFIAVGPHLDKSRKSAPSA